MGALLGHKLDTTGLAAERAGVFGKGWVALLRELGLGREEALNTLAEVAAAAQGPSGTLAIWQAFTTTLDTPEDLVHGRVLPSSASPAGFDEWLGVIRDKLKTTCVAEDAPYRHLTMMLARGITAEDKTNFFWRVQGWCDQVAMPGVMAERFDWASSLAEAIEKARQDVVDCRRRKGLKQICARELVRADAKQAAALRRVRPRTSEPEPAASAHSPTPAGNGPAKRPPKPKGRRPRGLPKRKSANGGIKTATPRQEMGLPHWTNEDYEEHASSSLERE